MKRKELLNIEPCHEPESDSSERVIATSQIIIDESSEGENITEIDLWWLGQLKARWFGVRTADKYDVYIVGAGWKKVKLENAARIIQEKDPLTGADFYYSEEYDWDTKEDEKRVHAEIGTYVDFFEQRISSDKRARAHRRKKQKVGDLIRSFPTIPNDMEEWLHRTIFPENYLFVKNHKKRTDYTCTVCGAKSWTKEKWNHNQMTICPKCGHSVIVKSRVQQISDKQRVTLLQKLDNQRWVERLFIATCTWSHEGKILKLYAEVCAVIPAGSNYGTVYYGQGFEKDEFEQDWWDSNPYNKRWGNSFLYPGNLQEVLPMMGCLQTSGMDIMAKAGRKFEVNKFIVTFSARPYMEYLIKSGFLQLAADILDEYGWWQVDQKVLKESATTLKEMFMLDGNRTNRLKQMDGGLTALKWLQYEQKTGSKITQNTLEYLQEQNITPYDCKSFIDELGSVNRAANYLRKQTSKARTTIEIWGDYLNMARNEGLDTTDDIVRFPKDLKARHDALVNIINERRDKKRRKEEAAKYRKLNKEIAKKLPSAKIYFWENEKYIFVPAGRCEELIEEGRTLHHCVGASDRYMKKMANGESWIVFLRKKEDIKKPYYTLEVDMKNDTIIQWYSEYDRKPDEKVISKLLTQYKNQIKIARLKETTSQEKELLVAAG